MKVGRHHFFGDFAYIVGKFEGEESLKGISEHLEVFEEDGKRPIYALNSTDLKVQITRNQLKLFLPSGEELKEITFTQKPRAIFVKSHTIQEENDFEYQTTTLYIKWKKKGEFRSIERHFKSGSITQNSETIQSFKAPIISSNRISISQDKLHSLKVFEYTNIFGTAYFCCYEEEEMVYFCSRPTDELSVPICNPWKKVNKNALIEHLDSPKIEPIYPHEYRGKTLDLTNETELAYLRDYLSDNRLGKLIKCPSAYFLNSIGVDIIKGKPQDILDISLIEEETVEVYKTISYQVDTQPTYLVFKKKSQLSKIKGYVFVKIPGEKWEMKRCSYFNHMTFGEYRLDDGSALHLRHYQYFRGYPIEKVNRDEWENLGLNIKKSN